MPVVRALTDRRALLVLDNCEQVAAACREAVASLLAACPTVTVLSDQSEFLSSYRLEEVSSPSAAVWVVKRSGRILSRVMRSALFRRPGDLGGRGPMR